MFQFFNGTTWIPATSISGPVNGGFFVQFAFPTARRDRLRFVAVASGWTTVARGILLDFDEPIPFP